MYRQHPLVAYSLRIVSGEGEGRMSKRLKALIIVASVSSVVAVSAPVQADPPVTERFTFDETYIDAGLSDACGVEVTVRFTGHSRVRFFTNNGGRLLENFTLNTVSTLSAGDNTYRLRDVGSDHIMVGPDGTATISIAGQIPLDFTGMLRVNLDTGEVVHEPQHWTGDELAKLCAELTS